MDQIFSIKEILSAVNEIQERKKETLASQNDSKTKEIDNSDIPISTLKLIEEAEQKNN